LIAAEPSPSAFHDRRSGAIDIRYLLVAAALLMGGCSGSQRQSAACGGVSTFFHAQHVQTNGQFLSAPPDGGMTFDADGCTFAFKPRFSPSSRSAQEAEVRMTAGGYYRANVSGIVSRRLGAPVADIEIVSVRNLLDVTGAQYEGVDAKALQFLMNSLPADAAQAQQVFDRRVNAAFAVGADEEGLTDALQRRGFELEQPTKSGLHFADLKRPDGVCQKIWSVRWTAKGRKITEIWGVYGFLCP